MLDSDFLPVAVVITVGAFVVGLLVWVGIKADDAFAADCEAKGGHIKSVSSSGYGITTSGKYAWTTTTTTYCLSTDGRILDIQ